jgi:hypothetical protein
MTPEVLFDDKAKSPTAGELAEVLGPAGRLWDQLREHIAAQYAPIDEEWVFSGKNHGWALRLKQKKRAVLYLKPLSGRFRASFAFGEKAIAAVGQSALPAPVKDLIEQAPKFPEGCAIRIEVRTARDAGVVEKLAVIKMAN